MFAMNDEAGVQPVALYIFYTENVSAFRQYVIGLLRTSGG